MSAPPDKTSVTFVDAFVPSLTAGKYTLTATQSLMVETEAGKVEEKQIKAEDKVFYIRAPRFSLAPDEIYSVYPPDGHEGPYHQTVPHVVCRRKALPWERPLVPGETGKRDDPIGWS